VKATKKITAPRVGAPFWEKDPLMTYEKALITQSRPGEIPPID